MDRLHKSFTQKIRIASFGSIFVYALLLTATTSMSVCFGIAPLHAADAANVATISRTVLERQPIADTDREVEVILVVYPPGATAPLHHHPSPGFNYVLEGTAESAYGSEAPRQYHAGETFMDLANVPHTVFRNPDRKHVLRFLIVANVRANQPYTVVP